jgi:hypothetical protein
VKAYNLPPRSGIIISLNEQTEQNSTGIVEITGSSIADLLRIKSSDEGIDYVNLIPLR